MSAVRRLTAILAADVAGYSRLMGADEEGTHERFTGHCQLKQPWYARLVGGAAARVGEFLCSPIVLPRSAERGRNKALCVR